MKFLRNHLDAENRVLFRNSSWVFFSNFFSTALAFIRSVIIARGLGPGIFGTYAIVVAFVGLIQEFLNLNTGTALIRFGAGFHTSGRNDKLVALVRLSVRFSIFMALLSVAVIALLSFLSYDTFFDRPGLEWFIIAYAFAAGITYINSISRGVLRLYYKFRLSSVIQMIMDVIETAAIAIAVIFYPSDLNIFFTAVIITRFVNGAVCNLMAYYELKDELGPHMSAGKDVITEDIPAFRDYVIANSAGNTLKTVINQGDVLLLGALAGPQQVGYYAVAKKLAYSVLTLTDPLMQSVFPQFSKLLAEKKYGNIRTMIGQLTKLALIPSVLFLSVAFVLNEWIIVTVYGNEYLPAAGSFFYFLTGAVLGAITFWTLPLVQSLGLVGLRVKAYVATIIAGSLIAWMLIPQMQAAGMALALLITNIMNMVIFIAASSSKMKTEENYTSTGKVL